GAGRDFFVLRPGVTATITDFEDGQDKFILTGGLKLSELLVSAPIGESPTDTTIVLAKDTSVVIALLEGIDPEFRNLIITTGDFV
ncbi:hypothetical protein J0895_20375, partial [Phormidium pseudopriestleyi FRX01]|nr:hypothetical protein [Phormidium pseudopriestleyi FRX01]